ncbi:MAG: exodeoxyribonuclease III [Myxococcales bacterium]|nr:exodeoxyribonuclease III [Myxococcales bacterium]
MKIATWNCNSVRARQTRLLEWLAKARPEVLCLQELKCVEEDFPWAELRQAGYHAACNGQRTYNGVGILSLEEPTEVLRGMDDGVDDGQARLIAANVAGVRIVSAYAPNGQAVGSPAYDYKLEWYGRLRRHLDLRHRPERPLVLCGDFNVAAEPIDVYDPAQWDGQTMFTEPERAALRHLLGFGLTDTFRKLHPGEPGRFSWWDYRMLAFPKNRGLRIDYLFATAPMADRCQGADIDREARKGAKPSDHAPVWADFRWSTDSVL